MMRNQYLYLLFFLEVVACGSGVRHTPRPINETPSPPPAASPPLAASPESDNIDKTEEESDAEPETVPMTKGEALEWMRAEMPFDAEFLLPPDHGDTLLPQLLKWANPGETITVYDRSCKRRRLTRDENSLTGVANKRTTRRGDTKTIYSEKITFSDSISLGCDKTIVLKWIESKWVRQGVRASGYLEQVGGRLSKVTSDAVWFSGRIARIQPLCSELKVYTENCSDQTVRNCTTCESIRASLRFIGGTGGGSGYSKKTSPPTIKHNVDCSAPCLPDIKSAELARASAVLEKMNFYYVGSDDPPVFFRTRKACQMYPKKDRMNVYDNFSWR